MKKNYSSSYTGLIIFILLIISHQAHSNQQCIDLFTDIPNSTAGTFGRYRTFEDALKELHRDPNMRGPEPFPTVDLNQYISIFNNRTPPGTPKKFMEPTETIAKFFIKYKDGRVQSFEAAVEQLEVVNGKLILTVEDRSGKLSSIEIDLSQVDTSVVSLIYLSDSPQFKLTHGQIPQNSLHYRPLHHKGRFTEATSFRSALDLAKKSINEMVEAHPFFFRTVDKTAFRDGDGLATKLNQKYDLQKGQVAVVLHSQVESGTNRGEIQISTGTIVDSSDGVLRIIGANKRLEAIDKNSIEVLMIHDPAGPKTNLKPSTLAKFSQLLAADLSGHFLFFDSVQTNMNQRMSRVVSNLKQIIANAGLKTQPIGHLSHAVANRRVTKGDQLLLARNIVNASGSEYSIIQHLQFIEIADKSALNGGPYVIGVTYPAGKLMSIPLIEVKLIEKIVD